MLGALTQSDVLLTQHDRRTPVTVGFVLIPGFPLLSYSCAVEPLRAANVLSGQALYRWRHFTPDGRTARASNGLAIEPDGLLRNPGPLDWLLVCAGGNPASFRDAPTLQALRRASRRGVPLGGLSGGAYILARAGVLGGHRFTLHWEHAPAFLEEFPDLDLRRCLFEIDRDRMTCGGGTASLDMMHAFLARQHGEALALAVSEWFLQTQIRAGTAPQRMSLRDRLGVDNPALLRALAEMEGRIEAPCPPAELAARAGVSVRQLERLFRAHLNRSPSAHYLQLRLERARALLRQTGFAVIEVATACGFGSASHFSRAYRAMFGRAPSRERAPAAIRQAAISRASE